MPQSMNGSRRRNSGHAAWRQWRTLCAVAPPASSAVMCGTANVSGTRCASSGTAISAEPKPVAPNTVYAARTMRGTAASAYQGRSGSGRAKGKGGGRGGADGAKQADLDAIGRFLRTIERFGELAQLVRAEES